MTTTAPTRRHRALVVVALALLVVPGLVGFDAWPLTAWRLFSADRTDHQTRWGLRAAQPGAAPMPVSLEELPLRYRNAEWPLSRLGRARDARREAVCRALLGAVRDERPEVARLEIVRDAAADRPE